VGCREDAKKEKTQDEHRSPRTDRGWSAGTLGNTEEGRKELK